MVRGRRCDGPGGHRQRGSPRARPRAVARSQPLLLLAAAVRRLGWFLWEQRREPLVRRSVVLVLSGALLVLAVLASRPSRTTCGRTPCIGRTVAVHHATRTNGRPARSTTTRSDGWSIPFGDTPSRSTGRSSTPWRPAASTSAATTPTRVRWCSRHSPRSPSAACLLILNRVTKGDPRALAFVGLNQFVIVTTVNNAHNDALVGLAALGAVVLVRRRPLFAGVVLGLAALVKFSALLPAGVLFLWLFRQHSTTCRVPRSPRGSGSVTVLGYAARRRRRHSTS